MQQVKGNIVDISNERIFEGTVDFAQGKITAVQEVNPQAHNDLPFILPGFIDAHVHIESSMLVPAEFARIAVTHGTVATVSDPHEIANVCGIAGVEYMIDNATLVNFKFNFGAPSCVPATRFETAGAAITTQDIRNLLSRKEIRYLSEMMNFPGVIFGEKDVLQKINSAHEFHKPVDGHAPGLRGEPLKNYADAGISTDHECFTAEEAEEKLRLGMKILIREGSAAKNFDALADLLHAYPDEMMFCTDDKHPDSLVLSHINAFCARAIAKGINIFNVLKAACINPIKHYKLDVGQLHPGDPADFILVKDLHDFQVISTYINGAKVAENGRTLLASIANRTINRFSAQEVEPSVFACNADDHLLNGKLPVIEALDGQLITNKLLLSPLIADAQIMSDPEHDILKLVVLNRYSPASPAIAFVKNFGLRTGAIASSVAHDSHNIIAIGVDDESIAKAINLIVKELGGISCVSATSSDVLPLPVAGLMSTADGYEVAAAYTRLDSRAKSLGSTLSAPFMTLSFMALLVIPALKLSDKGLFDGKTFDFVY